MQLTNDLSIKPSIKFRLFPGHGGAMTIQFFRTKRSEVAEMSSLALSKRFFRMEVREKWADRSHGVKGGKKNHQSIWYWSKVEKNIRKIMTNIAGLV